jgi:16S rRNA (guanine(966)-N(2))-methyltransferase RsmD
VKESLFNIIGPEIHGALFLDLFAGTGSVGIEALSRGASSAYFIDIDQRAIRTIRSNLELTSLQNQAKILRIDAITYLERQADIKFDYIYIAPPQYKGIWLTALKSLDSHLGWMSADAWAIVQIHPREYEIPELSNLVEFDQRTYGSTSLHFYQIE